MATLTKISTDISPRADIPNNSSHLLQDDIDNLPYPAPLPRSDFLSPSFDPSAYLSTLSNRHQSLQDLRTELRSRSRLLNTELIDLVNSNSQDFLTIGRCLTGGDERMEHMRVGLLAFRRNVEGVRKGVVERRDKVAALLKERKAVLKGIEDGYRMVEFENRLKELEVRLMIPAPGEGNAAGPNPGQSSGVLVENPLQPGASQTRTNSVNQEYFSDDEDEDDEGDDIDPHNSEIKSHGGGALLEHQHTNRAIAATVSQLRRHVTAYLSLRALADQIGRTHPFLVTHADRFRRVRSTLLLDLSSGMREARGVKSMVDPRQVLAIMEMYSDLGETEEGVRALKGK